MEVPIREEVLQNDKGQASDKWFEFFADKDAYKPFTPTVAASSGSFTTVSGSIRYKKKGRTCFINVIVTITTVGTAAGTVTVTLPFTSGPAQQVISGLETASSFLALTGRIDASTATLNIIRYDGTTAAASSRTLVLSGSYETAT